MSREKETSGAPGWSEPLASKGELAPGSRAGDYVIGSVIARGGCGTVYEASHHTSNRGVALKVLHRNLTRLPTVVKRFHREVDVVRFLEHPSIVQIHETGQLADGRPFYVMERLVGVTLDALLLSQKRLSPGEALELLEPVCDALEAAHAAGVVHRDVKASNILVTAGPPRAVKLLDFGIAKLLGPAAGAPALTTAGRAPGTLTIMAPEQILGGRIDARVDIYALGVLLHRMLTGKLPFYSTNATELARKHLEEPPPRPSQRTPLSPALDAVVLRCLEKQPDQRFSSIRSFVQALRDAVEPAARESAADHEAAAVAIHVDLRLHTDADELDDALVGDVGRVLDLAEERLRRDGFSLVTASGSEILAVRLLSGEPAVARGERRRALDLAASLHDAAARRPAADRRLHVNVCVHAGAVLVRSPLEPEIVGGPLLRVGAWSSQDEVRALCATPEAVEGLSRPDGALVLLGRPEKTQPYATALPCGAA